MITGNITISGRPREDDLRDGTLICSDCLGECQEVGVNNSFDDQFGLVTDWSIGSDCCGSDCCEGAIFFDKKSIHTARKDDPKNNIKAGQKYVARIRKGYYIDPDGEHRGICEYSKTTISK